LMMTKRDQTDSPRFMNSGAEILPWPKFEKY